MAYQPTIEIYHATATLAELGLAMSIAVITKLLPQPTSNDAITRETTRKRIKENDGGWVLWVYDWACRLSSAPSIIKRNLPLIVFFTDLLTLFGMALCTDDDARSVKVSFFVMAAIAFMLMLFYLYVNREIVSKSGEKPIIEPTE